MTGMTGGTARTVRRSAAPNRQSKRTEVKECLGCIGPVIDVRQRQYVHDRMPITKFADLERSGEGARKVNLFNRRMIPRVKPPAPMAIRSCSNPDMRHPRHKHVDETPITRSSIRDCSTIWIYWAVLPAAA